RAVSKRVSSRDSTTRPKRIPFMRLSSMIAAAVAATFVTAAHGEPVVLKAAYLFDSKSGQLTQGGRVVVDGERIVSIGGAAPADAKVIDLGDATLLPGFID